MKRSSLIALWAMTMMASMSMMGCNGNNNNGGNPKPDDIILTIPNIDRDSVYSFVQQQVDFGPRVPGSKAHKACADWMVGKFEDYGAKVVRQPFRAKFHFGAEADAENLIASFNPNHPRRVLLCAHWDTRYMADQDKKRTDQAILGADDGGSGVAVLLEIARQIQQNPIDLGVDIVLFDAEDQGDNSNGERDTKRTWCLGSQYWSRSQHTPGYMAKYGILLDMVGSKGATFYKEGTSMAFAPGTMNRVWKLARDMGYANYFLDKEIHALIDDHTFINEIKGIPTIDIINYTPQGFGRHWHTHNDNMDIISKQTLGAVGNVVLAVIYNESIGKF